MVPYLSLPKEFEADIYQDPVTVQDLLSVVEKANPDQLLQYLPAVDQEDYESRTHQSIRDQPKFYWIFKNMDFEKWYYTDDSEVLWLSGPTGCRLSDASSCIVDLVKEERPHTQDLVLYFFCSAASAQTPNAITVAFVSTIIHQLACRLPQLKGKVTVVFLRALLRTILREEPLSGPVRSRFKTNDSAEATMRKILSASIAGYWGALRTVMDLDRETGLSLIIDGLDKIQYQNYEFIQELCVFIEHLRERPSRTRVLLTSQPQAEIRGILGQLPSIEYDRERKGWIFLVSRFQNKHAS